VIFVCQNCQLVQVPTQKDAPCARCKREKLAHVGTLLHRLSAQLEQLGEHQLRLALTVSTHDKALYAPDAPEETPQRSAPEPERKP